MKPLGYKAYGSIGHLPLSRMGPADKSCHVGQQRICCETARDKNDRIIVTEKLDGSCISVAKVDGKILALGRSGYLASTAPFEHLKLFADYVDDNMDRFDACLFDGQRLVGEWLNVATGTKYDLEHEPFVIFDVFDGKDRMPFHVMKFKAAIAKLPTAYVISDGPPISINDALKRLGPYGKHGANEPIEGVVWRVERRGVFDYLVKFVRHDKIDGKYLPGLHGNTSYKNNKYVGKFYGIE